VTPEAAREAISAVLHRIAPEVDLDTVDADDDLREQIDIDSMDFLNALIAIEEQTGVEVPESDYDQVDTLNRLVAYIVARAV
jgi:acyl carrier protein